MSGQLQILTGLLTSAVFLGLGGFLWSEEQPLVGGLLLTLGAIRVVVWVRQVRGAFMADEYEDDEVD